MSEHTPVLSFPCPSCGDSPAKITLPDGWNDDTMAHCNSCGVSFGKYGEIAERIRQAQEIEGADHLSA
ncbi:hypothetical protein QWZ10_25170 [Paracoccus cavernae]|uniref:Restriction alleviation protein, Lar family n=1 Tax=Paracoccus cavernae TaxID=1571207 RepID=A0ABT8DBW1_9RHOB|nr:hypothetical protein [Paracoccus cavernae]